LLECVVRERDISLAFWRKASHKRPEIDYDETSLVMDATTLHYLVNLVVSKELTMQLMNVVITYLYGDLDMSVTQVKWLPTTERVCYGCNAHYMD
jgi:hypothetical protein